MFSILLYFIIDDMSDGLFTYLMAFDYLLTLGI